MSVFSQSESPAHILTGSDVMEKCNQRKWVQIFHRITFPLHLSHHISNVITFTTVLMGFLAALPVQQYFKHWCCAFLSIINSIKDSSIIQYWIQHNSNVDQKSDLWRVSYTLPWKVYCEHLGEKSLINWWFTVFFVKYVTYISWQLTDFPVIAWHKVIPPGSSDSYQRATVNTCQWERKEFG